MFIKILFVYVIHGENVALGRRDPWTPKNTLIFTLHKNYCATSINVYILWLFNILLLCLFF